MGGQTPRLKMIVKVFASCLLAVAAASSESSSSESGSREGFRGPGLYFSPIEMDLACTAGSPLGAKLASALRPVSVGSTLSSLRRLDLPLRGGGGGPTTGENAQLLSRSRPRWEREWKVTGVCSHSSAGSTRWETR